jgi:hypothetical protein
MNSQVLIKALRGYPLAVAGAALSLVIAAGGYVRQSVIPELELHRDDLAHELHGYEANVRNARGLEKDLTEARELVERIDSRIIDPTETVANLQFFLAFEQSAGIRLEDPRKTGITGGRSRGTGRAKTKATPFSEVAYTLDAKGELPSLLEFIHQLEESRYFVRLRSLTLSPSQDLSAGEMSATVSLSILGEP